MTSYNYTTELDTAMVGISFEQFNTSMSGGQWKQGIPQTASSTDTSVEMSGGMGSLKVPINAGNRH